MFLFETCAKSAEVFASSLET